MGKDKVGMVLTRVAMCVQIILYALHNVMQAKNIVNQTLIILYNYNHNHTQPGWLTIITVKHHEFRCIVHN